MHLSSSILLAATLGIGLSGSVASAQVEEFEAAHADAVGELVGGLEELAGWCTRKKLYEARAGVWRSVLEFDDGHEQARRGLGYLPERLSLPPHTRVHDLLLLHGQLAGLEGAECRRQVEATMSRTGVADRAQDRLGDLSKGLRQRVGFAQAFLGPPQLLLLDEPTSGLDPIGIRDAREWIGEARERGCTILISSHILSEVERTCDRLAILHEGLVRASGSFSEVVGEGESLEDAFVRWVRG